MKFSVVILCLAVLSILPSCRSFKSPTFKSISGLNIKRVNSEAATVGLAVTYYNPNNVAVRTKEGVINLYADSVYLGQFVQDAEIAVGRNSDFTIPLTGQIPIRSFLGLKLNGIVDRQIMLKADGSIKIGKAGVFVNQPIHYEGRHTLSELKKISPVLSEQGSN